MDFKEATDVLTSTPAMTLRQIADAFGRDMHTIARARMEGENSRRPPNNWQPVIAKLARAHARDLTAFANHLESLAASLDGHG
jgi:hypothetical protein